MSERRRMRPGLHRVSIPGERLMLQTASHASNTSHWTNVDLTLAHRLRLWANIESTLAQCLMFAGMVLTQFFLIWPCTGTAPTKTRYTQRRFNAGRTSQTFDQHWTCVGRALYICGWRRGEIIRLYGEEGQQGSRQMIQRNKSLSHLQAVRVSPVTRSPAAVRLQTRPQCSRSPRPPGWPCNLYIQRKVGHVTVCGSQWPR